MSTFQAIAPAAALTQLTAHAVLAAFFSRSRCVPATCRPNSASTTRRSAHADGHCGDDVFENIGQTLGATSVSLTKREVWHGLDYYARDRVVPLLSWRRYGVPRAFRNPCRWCPVATKVLCRLAARLNASGCCASTSARSNSLERSRSRWHPGNGCPITRAFHRICGSFHA